jgi:uncharacterized membrane protein (UPF0127 family)
VRRWLARRKAPVVAVSREDREVVCERCTIAATPLRRMKGLLGKNDLPPGEGLLLRPASSIHTLFMRFAIDVVFVDRDLVVQKVIPSLKPWRLAFARGARSALELSAGEAERRGVIAGQRLIARDLQSSP